MFIMLFFFFLSFDSFEEEITRDIEVDVTISGIDEIDSTDEQ